MATLRSIKGLVTFITGGASGLGKGTVEHLISRGGKVAIFDLPSSQGANVAGTFGSNQCIFIPGDVSSETDVERAFAQVKRDFGQLDAVVNCAGIAVATKIYNFSRNQPHDLKSFERVINVNLIGTVNVVRHACALFAEKSLDDQGQRGVIVNTSSVAAYDGQIGQTAYAASKGAIASLTLPLARDLAGAGIRVVTIAPGLFDTPLLQSLPPKVRTFLAQLVPNPSRLGNPLEFGALVQHIVENSYLNGEVIRLDGALRMPP